MATHNEFWCRAEAIFHEAVQLAEPERTAVIEHRCAGDTALMAELRSLLQACAAEEDHQKRASGSAVDTPPGRVGPYELDRLLGRGGMGAVYLAHRADGHFTQQVAVKLIDLPLATGLFRERFRAERQILAGLVHPYIARLLDGGVSESGEPYLAMEYIEGVPITRFCDERNLDIEARLELFRKVCDAVQFAHQNLVVHRDLKPDNILVDAGGTPHLLDFGTAKLLSPSSPELLLDVTQPGLQTFTPRYASPEQVLGRPITTASDTYSLGILLYVLLSGGYPYELADFTTEEMVRVIVQQAPARPGSVRPGIDADLDSIVAKALRKEPQQRYATVEQLSADVQAYLETRPVLARRGNLRYLAGRFVRRNTLAIAGASLLLLTLAAGIAGVLWQSHVANLQRRRAEERSTDLRELSISLLSELDEALKQIPGSTGAQKLLVTRVLEHLDRMAKDGHGDRETQLALIQAYTHLGNVQGNLYYQNVADTTGAIASFNRALALAEPLAARNPQDKEALRATAAALEARGETLSYSGDAQASAASLQAAVSAYERMLSLPGKTPAQIFEAAIAYETLGNELGEDTGLSDAAGATASYRRALAMEQDALKIDPHFMPIVRGIPLLHVHLGNVILETDPAQALREFQLGAAMQATLPEDQRRMFSQVRLHAVLLRKQADAYAELGDYAAAASLFDQARAIYQHLLDADSKNTAAVVDMQRLSENEARMYRYAADPLLAKAASTPRQRRENLVHALDTLQRTVALTREIIAHTPAHDPWTTGLASLLVSIGAIRHTLGMSTDADATRAACATLRAAALAPNATAGDIDLAVNASIEAQPLTPADTADAVTWAQHALQLTRGRRPEYLLLLARAYRADNQPLLAAQTARRGHDLLNLPDTHPPAQPSFRLEKLLTDLFDLRARPQVARTPVLLHRQP